MPTVVTLSDGTQRRVLTPVELEQVRSGKATAQQLLAGPDQPNTAPAAAPAPPAAPTPAPAPGAATSAAGAVRGRIEAAYKTFGPWTAQRGSSESARTRAQKNPVVKAASRALDIAQHPDVIAKNAAKGVVGMGPALSAMAGAAAREVPNVAKMMAAGLAGNPAAATDATAELVGGATEVGKSLVDQAKEVVKDPIGSFEKYPFELLGAGNAAAKFGARALAPAAEKVASAAGLAAEAEGASSVAKGVARLSESLSKGTKTVAEHGVVRPALEAPDRALRSVAPFYDRFRTAQEAGAAAQKVVDVAEAQTSLEKAKGLKQFYQDYSGLTADEQTEMAAHMMGQASREAGVTPRVAAALDKFRALSPQIQSEWLQRGMLTPEFLEPRALQPARIEEFGKAIPDAFEEGSAPRSVKQLGETFPTGVKGEASRFAQSIGGRRQLKQAVAELRARKLGESLDEMDPEEVKAQMEAPMTSEEIGEALQDPDLRRRMGAKVEERLQYERDRFAQRPIRDLEAFPKPIGQRPTYQLTRQEFEGLKPAERARRVRALGDDILPEDQYDTIVRRAVESGDKIIPRQVLEQRPEWKTGYLTPPNRRLLAATDEVAKALDERQATTPVYFPMMRNPRFMQKRAIESYARKFEKVKPKSMRTAHGSTYGTGDFVKDPRILAARMQSDLLNYQRAEKIIAGTKKLIAEGKIKARPISSAAELGPGEVAWNPEGLRMWRTQLEFGNKFLQGMQEYGVSEQGAARSLAEAMRASIGEGAFSVAEPGFGKPNLYAIPASVGETIRGAYAEAPAWLRSALSVLDTPTAFWRAWVLTARPAWIWNNIIGNVIFSTLNGVAPRHYLMALQEQFTAKTPESLNGIHLSSAESDLGYVRAHGGPLGEFLDWADQKPAPVGLWDAMQSGEGRTKALLRAGDPRRFSQAIARAGEAIRGVNQGVESFFRNANYLKEAERVGMENAVKRAAGSGMEAFSLIDEMDKMPAEDVDRILAKVNYFMHDYSNLNPFEREVVRRVIPFYNFLKHQTRLTLSLPLDYPGRAAMLQALAAIGKEAQASDNAKLPEWARDKGYIDTGFTVYVDGRPLRAFAATGGNNPFIIGYGPLASAQGGVQVDVPGIAEAAGSMLGPVPKYFALGGNRGFEPFTHGDERPLTFAHVFYNHDTRKWYDSRTGKETEPPLPDPVRYYVAQIPAVQFIRRTLNTKAGLTGEPLSIVTSREAPTTTGAIQLLKYFTPASVILIDQADPRRPGMSMQDARGVLKQAAQKEWLSQQPAEPAFRLFGVARRSQGVQGPRTATADSVGAR